MRAACFQALGIVDINGLAKHVHMQLGWRIPTKEFLESGGQSRTTLTSFSRVE